MLSGHSQGVFGIIIMNPLMKEKLERKKVSFNKNFQTDFSILYDQRVEKLIVNKMRKMLIFANLKDQRF